MNAINNGMSKHKASRMYQICRQTIYNWLELEKHTGSLSPVTGYQKGHSHKLADLKDFKTYVDEFPDLTQDEYAVRFSVGSSTIGRAMKKIGYTRKKRAKPTLKEMNKKDSGT